VNARQRLSMWDIAFASVFLAESLLRSARIKRFRSSTSGFDRGEVCAMDLSIVYEPFPLHLSNQFAEQLGRGMSAAGTEEPLRRSTLGTAGIVGTIDQDSRTKKPGPNGRG